MSKKQIISDSIWHERLNVADKYYQEWEKSFKCDVLEKYYEGRQWKSQDQLNYNPYTINKVYETIQIKLAQFMPEFPRYLVNAKPANSEYSVESASKSAHLKQDVINTIVANDDMVFPETIQDVYRESFFRFGVCEVGYAADWILNPNAPKAALKSDIDKNVSGKDRYKIAMEPEELPVDERVYFKHIKAKNFRIGGVDRPYLHQCGWFGYHEYVFKNDILSLKIMNRDKIECTQGYVSDSASSLLYTDTRHNLFSNDTFKVWHLWDMRTKQRIVYVDDAADGITIFQRAFSRVNVFDYRPDRRLIDDSFYPIPPVYHWLSPQDEINETREMIRAHRRRFVRKFQALEGSIDDTEIEKFESGPDGAIVIVRRENAITPIQNADLGAQLSQAVQTSGDDLNKISGTSAEVRGEADRTTATQAQIINQRSGIRENKEKDRLTKFMIRIGREVLLTVRDNFTLGIWVSLTSAEGEVYGGEVQENQQAYQWVSSEDLKDGYDFRIDVDVTSLTVPAQEEEKKKFMEFLAVLTQYPQLSFSPLLVREAAARLGYRNEHVIKELQKQALLMEFSRMQQLGMPQPGNSGQQQVAQQTPNTGEQIRNQLTNQLQVQ